MSHGGSLFFGIACLIFSCLLLTGIGKKNPTMILVWLVADMVILVVNSIYWVVFFIMAMTGIGIFAADRVGPGHRGSNSMQPTR